MQFLGVRKWCSANIFSGTKQKHACWEICKVRRFLAVLQKHIICNVKCVKVCKMKWVRFFERNCIVKCVMFLANFCSLWDFLLENLNLKTTLMMSTEHLKNVVCPKQYILTKNCKYEVLNYLYFGTNFVVFLGTTFFNFSSSVKSTWPLNLNIFA